MAERIYPTLCKQCGADLSGHGWMSQTHRLCPRHLEEARRASAPFACRAEDVGTPGESAADCGLCPECEHHHMPGERCSTMTAKLVMSYGEIVEDTAPHACGCRS